MTLSVSAALAQASKECGERFYQAQECGAIIDLVGDRLPLHYTVRLGW